MQCFLLVAVAGVGSVVMAQAGMRLIMNGKVVSTSVRMVDGQPYVPLADLATAQGMAVVKQPGGYEIKVAGGAHQVNGKLQGKMGDTLFTGKWGLTVLSVDRTAQYQSQFSAEKETTDPKGENDELVVVKCRLKNGKQESQQPMLSSVHPHNTALTTDQGESYAPVSFDKKGGNSDTGGQMLPGAQTTFAMIFSVPKAAVLKDLVVSLQTAYDDYPDGGTDVRVALNK